jgi:Flp pilus assembly protein CpaB
MKRGRIFIYLALIIIIAVAAGGGYLYLQSRSSANKPTATPAVPQIQYVGIVTAGQNIPPGTAITEAMLSSIQIPDSALVQGLFTNKADVVNMYAKYAIAQGVPITDSMVSATPGNVNLPGSTWAPFIPQGLTAVAIPITRLSSVAYGIRDGDYVNIIVTMLLVDVDPANQSWCDLSGDDRHWRSIDRRDRLGRRRLEGGDGGTGPNLESARLPGSIRRPAPAPCHPDDHAKCPSAACGHVPAPGRSGF